MEQTTKRQKITITFESGMTDEEIISRARQQEEKIHKDQEALKNYTDLRNASIDKVVEIVAKEAERLKRLFDRLNEKKLLKDRAEGQILRLKADLVGAESKLSDFDLGFINDDRPRLYHPFNECLEVDGLFKAVVEVLYETHC